MFSSKGSSFCAKLLSDSSETVSGADSLLPADGAVWGKSWESSLSGTWGAPSSPSGATYLGQPSSWVSAAQSSLLVQLTTGSVSSSSAGATYLGQPSSWVSAAQSSLLVQLTTGSVSSSSAGATYLGQPSSWISAAQSSLLVQAFSVSGWMPVSPCSGAFSSPLSSNDVTAASGSDVASSAARTCTGSNVANKATEQTSAATRRTPFLPVRISKIPPYHWIF